MRLSFHSYEAHVKLHKFICMTSLFICMTQCNTLQCAATQCNTLPHTVYVWHLYSYVWHTATHCNAPQHSATHCHTLYMYDISLHMYDSIHMYDTLQHTVMRRNTVQHTATHCVCMTSLFICMTWMIRGCRKTHSYVTLLIHLCDMTQSYMRLDSLMCVTWRKYLCAQQMSHVLRVSESCLTLQ